MAFFVGGSVATLFQILLLGPWIKRISHKNVRLLIVPQNREDLIAITELCTTARIIPKIDRRYSLGDVPEAMQYVSEGRAKGKVVITVP
jgi:NADPH:quinone reductase-like Zn-dependent oxidoreductase